MEYGADVPDIVAVPWVKDFCHLTVAVVVQPTQNREALKNRISSFCPSIFRGLFSFFLWS
jgi:hypothetical protein